MHRPFNFLVDFLPIRPSLYIGELSMRAFAQFINGVHFGESYAKPREFQRLGIDYFDKWLICRYRREKSWSGYGWPKMIEETFPDLTPEDQIRQALKLMRLYFSIQPRSVWRVHYAQPCFYQGANDMYVQESRLFDYRKDLGFFVLQQNVEVFGALSRECENFRYVRCLIGEQDFTLELLEGEPLQDPAQQALSQRPKCTGAELHFLLEIAHLQRFEQVNALAQRIQSNAPAELNKRLQKILVQKSTLLF